MVVNVLRFALAWTVNLLTGAAALLLALFLGPEKTWRLIAQRWGKLVLRLEKVELDVVGAEHMERPAIFIINHLSLIDSVYVPALLPPTVKFVVKKELAKIPLWGWALSAGGAILIDRSSPRAAMRTIRDGVRALPPGWSIVIFPEGTRSPDGNLQHFKKGAFAVAVESNLPIVPIGACGPLDIVPRGSVVIRPGTVHVTVGEPISSEGWTHATLDRHIAECRDAVERNIQASSRRREARLAGSPSTGQDLPTTS
jgi:1-acyl-sn-glycerol-3-phosphate acyltransferase